MPRLGDYRESTRLGCEFYGIEISEYQEFLNQQFSMSDNDRGNWETLMGCGYTPVVDEHGLCDFGDTPCTVIIEKLNERGDDILSVWGSHQLMITPDTQFECVWHNRMTKKEIAEIAEKNRQATKKQLLADIEYMKWREHDWGDGYYSSVDLLDALAKKIEDYFDAL